MAAGQPKPTFYVALALVVLGLIGFAVYRSDIVAPKPALPDPVVAPAPMEDASSIDLENV